VGQLVLAPASVIEPKIKKNKSIPIKTVAILFRILIQDYMLFIH